MVEHEYINKIRVRAPIMDFPLKISSNEISCLEFNSSGRSRTDHQLLRIRF